MSTTIRKYAFEFAHGEVRKQPRLRAEKFDLEAKLETVRVKLRRAETALDRASGFQERLDGRLQCPKCWVVSEVVTDLAPVSSDGGETRVRCGVCGTEFVV